MPIERFLDTNILLQGYDPDAPAKRRIAQSIIEKAWHQPGRTIISLQVLQEFLLRGQSYISVCNDLEDRRVLEVSLGRTAVEAAEVLKVVPVDPENMIPAMRGQFETVAALNLHTSRAWLVNENFARFRDQPDQARALKFFEQWEKQALKFKYPQVSTMAKALRRYLPGLLAYQLYPITNAVGEGVQ